MVGAGQQIAGLTVVVLAYNEEPNISRSLDSVSWAERIIVIDSGSADRTVAIAKSFPNVTVVSRAFTTHAEQWNVGLDAVKTPWTLAMDADYVFPDAAPAAIRSAMLRDDAGFSAPFRYLVYGKKIRGSVLPPRTILFRTGHGRYWQDGHTQQLQLRGSLGLLPFDVSHDDRKPISRWLQSQISYARLEAQKIASRRGTALPRNDLIRKAVVLAPPLIFLLVYVVRGGFLSGWRGLFYALQRLVAELLLSLFLIDLILQSPLQKDDSQGSQ